MIKKQLTTFLILGASIFTLAGCQTNQQSNQQAYTAIMAKGNQAAKQKNYSAAKAYFHSANLEKKDDSQAKALQQQAQHLENAYNYLDTFYFANAQDSFKAAANVKNGSSDMNQEAKKMQKKLKTVQKKRHDYNEQIEAAEQNNDKGRYQAAHAQVSKLIKTTQFHQDYYTDLYNRAVEVLLTSSHNLDGDDSSAKSTTTAKNDAASEKHEHSHHHTDVIQNPTANGKQITAADIQKARKELKEQGVQEQAASDSDIVRGIQQAASQGRSKVIPADVGE